MTCIECEDYALLRPRRELLEQKTCIMQPNCPVSNQVQKESNCNQIRIKIQSVCKEDAANGDLT